MRSLVVVLALSYIAPALAAQEPATREVPAELARRAAQAYAQTAAIRATGDLELDSTRVVHGSVVVREGWLTLGGIVHGNVVVINGNLTLRATSRVDGDVIVVGGFVEGAERASVGGTVASHTGLLHYRLEEGRIVVEGIDQLASEDSWVRRWRRRREMNSSRIIVEAGTYNRVEGLPIRVGGALRHNLPWGRISADALGILRSRDSFRWVPENRGYTASADVQYGKLDAVVAGVRLYDVVDGVEQWHLRDSEVGLASFFLRRDYRDYFARRGGGGYVTFRDGTRASFTVSLGSERWTSRDAGDVFTLFRNAEQWRSNPMVDEGRFRLLTATLTYDTRNDRQRPRSGWLLSGEVENGRSDEVRLGILSPTARGNSLGTAAVEYTRVSFDLRRYNRLSPTRQLNARLVLGGWVDGDDLPIQRRFSLGGPGTLPGYDFHDRAPGNQDVFRCSDDVQDTFQPVGRPAQCERVVLAQLEYRADIPLGFGRRGELRDFGFHRNPAFVLFADAGRGWLVGPVRQGELVFTTGSLPPLSTFRADGGVGLDLGLIGVYVAKSLTDDEGANVFVRLRQRF